MFQRIKDLVADFPWDDEVKPKGSFFFIKDTIYNNANFMISQILNIYLKKNDGVSLIAATQNYAHYLNTLKRTGQNIVPYITREQLTYIDLFSNCNDWVPEDLPFIEETHQSWTEPPSNALKLQLKDNNEQEYYTKIVKKIEQSLDKQEGNPSIIIDNLTNLFDRTQNKALLYTFVCSLIQLCKTHAKKPSLFILSTCTFDQDLQRLLGIIESYADSIIEVFENPSGYQKDIAGQIVIKVKKNNKIAKFLYSLTENSVEIKDTYTI
ncbi:hypothetical protein ABPG74_001095 [Tetrahymena malaccensis]